MASVVVDSWLKGRGRSLRMAALWQVTRRDGAVLRFTDHDQEVTYAGNVFTPLLGIDATARQRQADLENSNLDVVGVLDDSSITDEELAAGLWRGAMVEEFLVDWRAPWAGYATRHVYFVTETKRIAGESWVAKLQGLTRKLEPRVGLAYTRNCRHTLGDSLCGVDLGPLTESGAVTVVDADNPFRVFEANGSYETILGTDPLNWDLGVIEWTTGNNALGGGVGRMEIKRVTGSNDPTIELQLAMPYPVEVGDQFDITPGCDKTGATCKAKFNNFVQYGGFPFIPGNDRVLQTPRAK